MKAELNEEGLMIIRPESPVEAYALRKWVESALISAKDEMRAEDCHWRGSKLMTNAAWPQESNK